METAAVAAYLSLGSNVGDRLDNLRQACRALSSGPVCLVCTSSIYETEPVDFPDQPWFLNCVVEVKTTLEPLALLRELQRIEARLGRPALREQPKGPRTIDIDILLYGDLEWRSEELTVPHPRMLARRFVLEPLREIAPSLHLPGSGKTGPGETGPAKTVEEAFQELRDPAQVRRLIATLCA